MIENYFLSAVHLKNIPERIAYFGELFLGAPYVNGPQGEGEDAEFDQSPLYRFDCFDCVTYVNNVLALSFSNNTLEFKHNLLKLNYYDSKPEYQNRFHFMSIDWNSQNQKNNFLRDMTADIAEPEYAIGEIDKPNWFLKRSLDDIKLVNAVNTTVKKNLAEKLKKLQNLSQHFKKQTARLAYLPTQKLLERNILEKISHGAIIEVVRPNWNLKDKIGTNLHVSHIGFGIRKNNNLYFRHASSEHKKVEEVLLKNYLQNFLDSATIKGVNIQCAINDNISHLK